MIDAMLMLSGGKDSCSLAFLLKAQGVNYTAITIDNGFLSQTAFINIFKTCQILDIDHVFIRPKRSIYRTMLEPLMDKGMETVCTQCSAVTIELCRVAAHASGAKKLYAGFTKYTAAAAGWKPALEKELADGMILVNPYYETYDLSGIRKTMADHGLELDPIKTNCVLLPELLRTTNKLGLPNHLLTEIKLLLASGQITKKEYKKYEKFLCQT